MKRLGQRRITLVGAIALTAILLLSLLFAPSGDPRRQGSSYSRSPDGYGAWYAEAQTKGVVMQRWEAPLEQLGQRRQPLTLIRISPRSDELSVSETIKSWVARGNTLILLGAKAPVTDAPFSSSIPSPDGAIKIDTSRRQSTRDRGDSILSDVSGAVVWKLQVGQGAIFFASTPYLAANAYQNSRGNFDFLTKLVREAGHPVWIDEYLHGFKNQQERRQDTAGSLIDYLAQTPLALLAIQAVVLLGVMLWGLNQRFGPTRRLDTSAVDNSNAYIEAMAAVLHKAGCSEFVIDTIRKAEQTEIQRALGLGTTPLPSSNLIESWMQQTGQSAETLQRLLRSADRKRQVSDPDLLRWVETIQTVRHHLPNSSAGAPRP